MMGHLCDGWPLREYSLAIDPLTDGSRRGTFLVPPPHLFTSRARPCLPLPPPPPFFQAAGAAGVLVPDIPLEETGPIRASAEAAGLEAVLLVTPTTPKERMRAIAAASHGFVYLVSLTGVTGMQSALQARVEGLIGVAKSVTDKPIAVGFGVSNGDQAAQLVQWGADGVIVGSALVKALGEAATPAEGLKRLEALAVDLRAGLNRHRITGPTPEWVKSVKKAFGKE